MLGILLSLPLVASTIAPLDLNALNGQSTLVVTGYVTAVRNVREGENIATVRIASVLRGEPPGSSLKVRMHCGLVFFDRFLKNGDSGVFFLNPSDDGNFETAYPGSFALFQKGTVRKPDR